VEKLQPFSEYPETMLYEFSLLNTDELQGLLVKQRNLFLEGIINDVHYNYLQMVNNNIKSITEELDKRGK
jgi:hypothetical protein